MTIDTIAEVDIVIAKAGACPPKYAEDFFGGSNKCAIELSKCATGNHCSSPCSCSFRPWVSVCAVATGYAFAVLGPIIVDDLGRGEDATLLVSERFVLYGFEKTGKIAWPRRNNPRRIS
jgi:hypothetical protein